MKMSGNFKEKISKKSRENDSKLILALDLDKGDIQKDNLEEKYIEIAKSASDSLAAIKAGYPVVLKNGLEIISKIKKETEIPIIADFKIADVPHICQQIAKSAYQAKADAVIAQGFVGRDSLEAIVEVSERKDKGVIVVPSMSHEGGKMFIQKFSQEMLELAQEVGSSGVIGPATRPEDVEELRSKVGQDMLVLTPGIGAQGGKPGDAIKSGADYEIVGRAIYTSDDPGDSAEEIRKKINETMED